MTRCPAPPPRRPPGDPPRERPSPRPLAAALSLLLLGGCLADRSPRPPAAEVVLPELADPAPQRPTTPPPRGTIGAGPSAGLVSAAWAASRLDRDALRVVDLRPAAAYRQGHLPGSWSDPEGASLLTARPEPRSPAATVPAPAPVLVARGRALAAKGRTVVLVHGGRSPRDHAVGARAFLLLHAAGVDLAHLALLSGGYAAWRSGGFPLVTGPPPPGASPTPAAVPAARPHPGPPPAPTPGAALLVDPGQAKALLSKGAVRWLPATGEGPRPDPARAAPPPAVAMAELYLNPVTGRRRPAAALRRRLGPLLAEVGPRPLLLWSEEGLWSSLLWLTLRLAVNPPGAAPRVYFGPRPALPPRPGPAPTP